MHRYFFMKQLFLKKTRAYIFCSIPCRTVTVVVLWLCSFTAVAQSNSYTFTPVDSEFTMQISREKTDVKIILTINDSLSFDYIAIERKADNPEFSQCKYISFDELKTRGRHLIEKDMYPYAGNTDVLYRLKLVTKDGAERTYPPINLPAVKK